MMEISELSSIDVTDLSVKVEGEPPDRDSPPPNCVICMDRCRDKSFTDTCLHEFCFNCLLTWSRIKAECPLCKQHFRSIIHNIQPNQQYDEYPVQNVHLDNDDGLEYFAPPRYRYRTTVTLPRHEGLIAIRDILLESYQMLREHPSRRHSLYRSNSRQFVYRSNVWARPLPDYMGRYRQATPTFYRQNESQVHRLVPWVKRELCYLLNENNSTHSNYVASVILGLLTRSSIISIEFRDELFNFFGARTDHFTHELFIFASTPFEMFTYDRNVQYTSREVAIGLRSTLTFTDLRPPSHASDSGADSDVLFVEPPPNPPCIDLTPTLEAGPSHEARDIPIETISAYSSDDDEDVMVVGYVKPPQDRTPEIVDLIASDVDSDVILQEFETPEPVPHEQLVKFTLKSVKPPSPWSDSDIPMTNFQIKKRRSPSPDSSSDYAPSDSSDQDSSESQECKSRKRKYVKKTSSKSRKRKCSDRSEPRPRKKKSRSAKDAKSSRKQSERGACCKCNSHEHTHGGRSSPQAGPSGVIPDASSSRASTFEPPRRRLRSVVAAVNAIPCRRTASYEEFSPTSDSEDDLPLASAILHIK